MNARRGPLIGATWLIGLGIILLVYQASGLSWAQAWPLFVILVGVASFVSTALTWRPGCATLWAFTWPIAWIVVGAILLAGTTGNLGDDPASWLTTYWPYAAILLGIWFVIGAIVPGPKTEETLALPLEGLQAAAIRMRFGAGTLAVGPAADSLVIDGTYTGGVVVRRDGPGRFELSQDTTYGLPWLDRESSWKAGLSAAIPLDLRFDI